MGADSLGDRMKENYENRGRHYLTRRTPVVVRVDGRAFHTYTRGLKQPFDDTLGDAMGLAALDVAQDMQGCKLVYVQSDEASFLLTDFDQLTTEAWFGYNKSKVETIAASAMTAYFNERMPGGPPCSTRGRSTFQKRKSPTTSSGGRKTGNATRWRCIAKPTFPRSRCTGRDGRISTRCFIQSGRTGPQTCRRDGGTAFGLCVVRKACGMRGLTSCRRSPLSIRW